MAVFFLISPGKCTESIHHFHHQQQHILGFHLKVNPKKFFNNFQTSRPNFHCHYYQYYYYYICIFSLIDLYLFLSLFTLDFLCPCWCEQRVWLFNHQAGVERGGGGVEVLAVGCSGTLIYLASPLLATWQSKSGILQAPSEKP